MEREVIHEGSGGWRQRFVEAVRRTMNLSTAAWLLPKDAGHVVVAAFSGDATRALPLPGAVVQPGALAAVISGAKPLVLNPSPPHTMGVPYSDKPVVVAGALGVPTADGWFWADRSASAIQPAERDGLIEVARLVAEQGGHEVALAQAEQRIDLLARTLEGARLLLSSATEQDCLGELVDAAARVAGAAEALVVRLDGDQGRCRVEAARGEKATVLVGREFDPAMGLIGLSLRTGQAMPTNFVATAVTRDVVGGGDLGLKIGEGLLVHPLGLHGEMHGALVLCRGDFDRDWLLHAVRALCNAASLYLHQARLRDRLARDAMQDALTGLPNKRAFLDTLVRLMALCRRHGAPLTLLMVDIDHFKRVNDTHGHLVGDRVLRTVAETIGHALRESDSGGRYGGEEFCVVLPYTDMAGAVEVAERIRRLCEAVVVNVGGLRLSLTVSVGVAVFTAPMRGPEDLIKPADDALYQAKRAGRNRVVSSL